MSRQVFLKQFEFFELIRGKNKSTTNQKIISVPSETNGPVIRRCRRCRTNCSSGFPPTERLHLSRKRYKFHACPRGGREPSRTVITEPADAELLAASTPLKHIVVPPKSPVPPPMPSQELHDVPLHPLAPPPKAVPHHHVVHENQPAAGPQVMYEFLLH